MQTTFQQQNGSQKTAIYDCQGPSSGKTRSLTLLAMNLLLCKDAEPSQIVLCTYTEKAAYELQASYIPIAEEVV